MSRNVIININNQTGYDLTYVTEYTEHGDYQKGKRPPGAILKGETGTFGVGLYNDFSWVGPKGVVTYYLQYARDIRIELKFFWDHPHGASASSYWVGSFPEWYASYSLYPPVPEGQDQIITLTVSLNSDAMNTAKWMESISRINPDYKLRDLLIPGSHDSGTYAIGYSSSMSPDYESWLVSVGNLVNITQGWAKAQADSVYDQLRQGIRYLDLRLSNGFYATMPVTGEPIIFIGPDDPVPTTLLGDRTNVVRKVPFICHSMASVKPSLIFDQIRDFLNENPKEIVLINFQHFYNYGAAEYGDLVDQLKSTFGNKMLSRYKSGNELHVPGNITLRDMMTSGKQLIVFFDKDHQVTVSGQVSSGASFDKSYAGLYNKNEMIWAADAFLNNPYPNEYDINALKKDLKDSITLDRACFQVMQGVITPADSDKPISYTNALTRTDPFTLEQLGNIVSPQVTSWVNNLWSDQPINIIMLDWVTNSPITQVCYMINKARARKYEAGSEPSAG